MATTQDSSSRTGGSQRPSSTDSSPHGTGPFRKQALERLQSPERLEQAMRVTTLADWIPLSALAAMALLVLIWSIVGRVSVNVVGNAALIYPRTAGGEAQIVEFEAPGSGKLLDLRVNRGDRVRKGQVLAVLDQPELRKQIESQRSRLVELREDLARSEPIRTSHVRLSQTTLAAQRQSLRERIAQVAAISPELRSNQLEALKLEREALVRRLKDARDLVAALSKVRDSRRRLREQELISDNVLFEAERNHIEALHHVSDLELQLRTLDFREVEIRKAYAESRNQINELGSQLKDLEGREKAVMLDYELASSAKETETREIERRISELEHQLKISSEVVSDASGTILEIDAVVGQIVSQGSKLGAIQTVELGADGGGKATLQGVAYFTVADGKRIKPGMRVQLTPATVKRVEYGGIVGRVTHVSTFVVSKEGAANLVNNRDVAHELTAEGHQIEVFADLEPDPGSKSGFSWSSSRGPEARITAGTTGTMLVTIEDRAPITLVFPFLRAMSDL